MEKEVYTKTKWKPFLNDYIPGRILILLGAVAVGKGFTFRTLAEDCPFTSFGMGEIVRQRLDTDPVFKSNYGKLVTDGYLVPDHETIPMAYADLDRLHRTVLSLSSDKKMGMEGYFRNKGQVRSAVADSMIAPENTLVLDLKAHSSVLRARQIDRLNRKPNGPRFDEHSFENRLKVHHENHGSVRHELALADIHVVEIDADYDLEIVARTVASYAIPFWNQTKLHPRNVCERVDNPVAVTSAKRLRFLQDRRTITTALAV